MYFLRSLNTESGKFLANYGAFKTLKAAQEEGYNRCGAKSWNRIAPDDTGDGSTVWYADAGPGLMCQIVR